MRPAGQALESVVSPATFALVSRRVADLGMPVEPLKRFKPWMLALTLLSLEWLKAGFDPDLGLDKHFYDRARTEGKPVQGLETLDFQISRFDEMTPNEQDRLLTQTLKELDTQRTSVTTLANAWKAGDASTIERIVLQDVRQEPQITSGCSRPQQPMASENQAVARPGRRRVVGPPPVGNDGPDPMLARGYTSNKCNLVTA